VTHDQVEAMSLATRIAVMNEGIIQQIGTPQEIYDKPNSVFVADFIGSPAINLIQVHFRKMELHPVSFPNSKKMMLKFLSAVILLIQNQKMDRKSFLVFGRNISIFRMLL